MVHFVTQPVAQPTSGPTRPDERHGHDRDQRPGRVGADVDRRWVSPGHEPPVELVRDRVEDRNRQRPGRRRAPGRGRCHRPPEQQGQDPDAISADRSLPYATR